MVHLSYTFSGVPSFKQIKIKANFRSGLMDCHWKPYRLLNYYMGENRFL